MKRLPRIHPRMARFLSAYVDTKSNGDRHVYTHWQTGAINKAANRAFSIMNSFLLQYQDDVCLGRFGADVDIMRNAAPLYNDQIRINVTAGRNVALKIATRRSC